MKKTYLVPEMEVVRINTQTAVLLISNGENVTVNKTYSNVDEAEFWD